MKHLWHRKCLVKVQTADCELFEKVNRHSPYNVPKVSDFFQKQNATLVNFTKFLKFSRKFQNIFEISFKMYPWNICG